MSKVRLKMSQPGTDEVYAETLRKLYSQLEALRFGPSESVEVAVPIFKKTRKVLWGRKGFSS
jgi:hypothetical protein